MTDRIELSADTPSTNPSEDMFGHAPFARTLAKAIRGYQGSDGIVLALYAPWGAGKSTVLAYVQHELEQGQEAQRPVVVPFNPWWFSGQEGLAKTFLGQLQAVLPAKYAGFNAVGEKLAEFAEALGGVTDLASAAFGIPIGGKVIEAGAKLLRSKPKDVPALKKALADLLRQEKKRVLVIIDDIDRLSPDEIRQLFTVIKALADFPFVTYLLAFDREVAAAAISEQTGLPGERYLEKIIQVPFELPRPDRIALRQALFKKLDQVIASSQPRSFDATYWANVYHLGLDPLITVPRDVVRLGNVLSVTYPAVVDEVNPVDFIAIETLRLFLPSVYEVIRTFPDRFVGYGGDGYGGREAKEQAQNFHQGWLETVPAPIQNSTKELLKRLFPRLESVWSNMYHGGDSLSEWRRDLRICAPEIYPAYFRLALLPGAVSRAEVDALLASTSSPGPFAALLKVAIASKGADGVSKVPALLERFLDHVEKDVASEDVTSLIDALFYVGDELLLPTDRVGMFDFDNETHVTRIVYHLLKRVELAERPALLIEALSKARALRCSQYLIGVIKGQAEKAATGEGDALIADQHINAVLAAWCERVRQLSIESDFIDRPSAAWVVEGWREWGNAADAVTWWQAAAADDEGLLKLIKGITSESRSQSATDVAWRVRLRINLQVLTPYGDLQVLAERVRELSYRGAIAEQYQPAATEFLLSYDQLKPGESSDLSASITDDGRYN